MGLPAEQQTVQSPSWQERYGGRHSFVRLAGDSGLPNGRRGRVTIYQRGLDAVSAEGQTFILSWSSGGKRKKERVIGDRFDAVRRADEINSAVSNGTSARKTDVSPETLVQGYLELLERRAQAGEVAPNTPTRYRSALVHLTDFIQQEGKPRSGRTWTPTRDLILRFRAHLQGKMVSPNGHSNTQPRPLSARGIDFVVASVRALVRWAIQEGLLPPAAAEAFSSPCTRHSAVRSLSASPITSDGLIRLIQTADLYQLALFSFHIFHGVRVAEPCWVMIESVDTIGGWIDYRCIEELGYRTKGAVDKRLPVPEPMTQVIARLVNGRSGGPLLLKRRAFCRSGGASKGSEDLRRIIESVHRRHPADWSGRLRAATAHLKTLGTIEGDDIRREFAHLVRDAGIQSDATPKALRHHFATALERANVPYYTRKYLLGHRLGEHGGRGSDITAIYTHLEPDLVRAAYQRVLDGPLAKIRDAFASRLDQLLAAGSQNDPRQF
jgi:integrase